jgi:muconolactone delta-isomerase
MAQPAQAAAGKPAENRLTAGNRPTSFVVIYDMAPGFFDLTPDAQYKLQIKDAAHAVALAIRRIWRAAFTTTDLKRGWILLAVKSQAEAEQVIAGYPTRQYLNNLTYTRVFNATQAGINLQIILKGIAEFLTSPSPLRRAKAGQ